MCNIKLPKDVIYIIDTFYKNGYKAYAVGGCIRDSLLGVEPKDWDICTNAKPDETKAVFSNINTIDTGIQHGTVTLRVNHTSYEVTTFRSESDYSDSRHPDRVIFEAELEKDLSRRDFTMNSIAYNHYEGIQDIFGGASDINNKVIRTVGNSDDRFNEDALRIMRALRFSAVLGFDIEPKTAQSIHKNKQLLNNIAVERIWQELIRLICGKNAIKVLREYVDVIAVFIPEISYMVGFEQHSPYHIYDVWEHTLKALENAPSDLIVRLALLFHDIGKPQCFNLDESNIGHFYGHPNISAEMTRTILRRLKVDNETTHNVVTLVEFHDIAMESSKKSVSRAIRKVGSEPLFERLVEVKKCDILGQAGKLYKERLNHLEKVCTIYNELKNDNNFVIKIKNLKITGRDIISLGVPQSKKIGELLNTLFTMVADGEIENENNVLIEKAKEIIYSDKNDKLSNNQ